MGDKGGKKDKAKSQKQKQNKEKQKEKQKQEKQPKRTPWEESGAVKSRRKLAPPKQSGI